MWKALGFKKDPYDASPLEPRSEDVDLLVGRSHQGRQFATVLESSNKGMSVISGVPGVGKTSFLNIHQYLLETDQMPFGPSVLAARNRCHIQPDDDARTIALRSTYSICRNVQEYCATYNYSQMTESQKVYKWLSAKSTSGYSIGLSIFAVGGHFGRNVQVPPVSEISFEGISDVLTAIVTEAINFLPIDGVILALDNVENMSETKLSSTLMTFRDTLFDINGVWWVLIGQSGFASLLQTLDPRVSDRLAGKPIELEAISFNEFEHAIARRVSKFHYSTEGNAPLPKEVHELLYKASHGEIRFVFKYSSIICQEVISRLREDVTKAFKEEDQEIDKTHFEEKMDSAIGEVLVEKQIDRDLAREVLIDIIRDDVNGLSLRQKERKVLKQIGDEGGARAKDYKHFGLKTQGDFSNNYLVKYYKQNLLARRQEGRIVVYTLRGVLALAAEFGLLEGDAG